MNSIVPKEKDLTFFINVYRDVDLLYNCLFQLRKHYPKCPLILRSDGDNNPAIKELSEKYNATFFYRERLIELKFGGAIVHEMLELFLRNSNSRFLFKMDPDTLVHRKFNSLPGNSCIFGMVQEEAGLKSIQGGCIGFTRDIAQDLMQSQYFLDPNFATNPPIWAISKPLKNYAAKGFTSFDWTIGWACKTNNIKLVNWPEIKSEWKITPKNPDNQYAITHPHK